MISFETVYGTIEISQEYFANLIGRAASECFGVAGMISSPYQGFKSVILKKENAGKGVRVQTRANKLTVDLHIAVTYGVNINAIVESIIHKVTYTVEKNTGIPVANVTVFVDAMTAQ